MTPEPGEREIELRSLPLDVLLLDPMNPRLPESIQGATQDVLMETIASDYNAIEVARSIARHGYFLSEPLIVLPEGNHFVVVEGNRRLVALRLLADPTIAGNWDDAEEWRELAGQATVHDEVPVVVVPSREAVAPIIGYRHISGIEPWDPYAKARFIAGLIEGGMDFTEVASIVGEKVVNVQAQFRNYRIVREAQSDGVDATRAVRRFGTFTRAMNAQGLRDYIAVPAPSQVAGTGRIVPTDRVPQVKELFSWLYGDGGEPAVIGESRDITQLASTVASEDGLRVLRATRDLEAAFEAAGGIRDRLLSRLNNAANALKGAREDFPSHATDEQVRDAINRVREALDELTESGGE